MSYGCVYFAIKQSCTYDTNNDNDWWHKRRIQSRTQLITTRLWVTSSWYLRWRWIAKNLSKVNEKTPKCEAQTNIFSWIKNALYAVTWAMLSVFCCMFITRIATYSGWTSKLRPRSDTARKQWRSNVFKVFANDGVFLSACIVKMFNTMLVKHKKALKTQLTTSVKCKPLALAIFSYYITLISVQFLYMLHILITKFM